jgi:type II secretory pathway component PulJ
MMVAVTLLAVIMVGLLAMFQYTQRALHIAHTQTDVFENARGAIQLVTRDLSEMSDYGDSNVLNLSLARALSPVGTLQPTVSPTAMRIFFDETYWLTHVNTEWQGIGYFVEGATNYGVGTLYRFSQTTNQAAVPGLYGNYTTTTNYIHRVSDGIVHFVLDATYGTTNANGQVVFDRTSLRDRQSFTFPTLSNGVPAFIDLEIGVLEPATLKQFQAIASLNTPAAIATAQTFLQDHVGKIHFFRERVPIRNFINPYRENEVQ